MKVHNTLSQLCHTFDMLEKELSEEKTTHHGINVYFFLKVYVTNSYFIDTNYLVNSKKSGLQTHKALIRAIKSLYQIFITPSQILFASRSTYWSKVGQHSIHRFFDTTLNQMRSQDSLILSFDELTNNPMYPHVYETNQITKILSSFSRKWLRFFRPDILGELNKKAKALILLVNHIHNFNEEQALQRIINNFSALYILKPFYKFILRFKGINTIYMTCFYSIENLAMIMASKELKINTIDIQHGVINKSHPAYNSFHSKWNILPEKIWVWSIREKEILVGLGWPEKTILITGSQYNCIDFSNYINEKQRRFIQNLKNDTRTKILVCLQTYMFEYEDFYSRFSDIIEQTQDSVFWMVRLHPSMINNIDSFKNRQLPSNLDVVESSELYLPPTIQCSDFMLTMNSSVVLDFTSVGKKVLFFRREDREFYAELISHEQSILIEDNNTFKKSIGL